MKERPDQAPTDLTRLPSVGTPERLEWDVTIREVIELYPDWAWVHVGKARLRRETYETDYKDYYEGDKKPLPTGPPQRQARRPTQPARPPKLSKV